MTGSNNFSAIVSTQLIKPLDVSEGDDLSPEQIVKYCDEALQVAESNEELHGATRTVPFLEGGPVATGGLVPAGISELRWAPAYKAGSIHVVNSGKAPGRTGETLLCVAVGRSGPHAAR